MPWVLCTLAYCTLGTCLGTGLRYSYSSQGHERMKIDRKCRKVSQKFVSLQATKLGQHFARKTDFLPIDELLVFFTNPSQPADSATHHSITDMYLVAETSSEIFFTPSQSFLFCLFFTQNSKLFFRFFFCFGKSVVNLQPVSSITAYC